MSWVGVAFAFVVFAVCFASKADVNAPAWPYFRQNVRQTNFCPNSQILPFRAADNDPIEINANLTVRPKMALRNDAGIVVGQNGFIYGIDVEGIDAPGRGIVVINLNGVVWRSIRCNASFSSADFMTLSLVTDTVLVAYTNSGYSCGVSTDAYGNLTPLWSVFSSPAPSTILAPSRTSRHALTYTIESSNASTVLFGSMGLRFGNISWAYGFTLNELVFPYPPAAAYNAIYLSWDAPQSSLVRYDFAGSSVRIRRNISCISSPMIDPDGNVYVLGSTPSPWSSSITDYWLYKFDSYLINLLWQTALPSSEGETLTGTLSFDEAHGFVVVSGWGAISQFTKNGTLYWWIPLLTSTSPAVLIDEEGDYFYQDGSYTCAARWNKGKCQAYVSDPPVFPSFFLTKNKTAYHIHRMTTRASLN